MTTTTFKPKTCPKCRNNHHNEGVLCSFCIAKEDEKRAKVKTAPPSFWVRCLIKREGDTVTQVGAIRYTFKRNEYGHAVCEVINQGHYDQLIKGSFYEPYEKPEGEPEQDQNSKAAKPEQSKSSAAADKAPIFSDDQAQLIQHLSKAGKKATEIAQILGQQFNVEVPYQRVTRYLATLK